MDASTIPKGQSKESNSDGRPLNLPGIYVHKESGAKFITTNGDEGVAQADALMVEKWRGGWERVGDVPSRVELLAMNKAQQIKDAKAEAAQKKADEAEMKALLEEDEADKETISESTETPEDGTEESLRKDEELSASSKADAEAKDTKKGK